MPSDKRDPLQSLIADILEAENRGETVDRDALLSEHPEHSDSLRDFFAQHDRMKSAAEAVDPTLPPSESIDEPTLPPKSAVEDVTIPPSSMVDDPTIAPTEPATQTDASVGDKVRYFGDYELLEEIARGGMGVVFKARQMNLNRTVALKMILAGQFAGAEDVQRFYTEAEAAAALDHPGIVPIFEIGEHADQHYFSMGYIEGESLAQRVVDGPLQPREAAEVSKEICEAMAYAHERGVIHRDLKPANILIDSGGQPKVTDFGLAKKTEADSGLTGTGQILGTPAYMPPEQASGKTEDVGTLADVYSLGAILYCLLTGRPPFQAASPMDTLLQVLDQDPVSPRSLNAQVPQDLETICLKCLRKEATKRYESAAGLGAELQRYLNGEPIMARPVGRLERSWRWCKRKPALASLSTLTVASLLFGTAFSIYFAIDATQHAAGALAAQRAMEIELYRNKVSFADSAWKANDAKSAWAHLNDCSVDLRGWEHDYLYTRFTHGFFDNDFFHRGKALSLAFSSDGKRVVSGGEFFKGDFPEAGPLLVWNPSTGKERLKLKGHSDLIDINSVTFSPDGKQVVSGGGYYFEKKDRPTTKGEIKVWDAHTGQQIRSLDGHSMPVLAVAMSPDGRRIVAGSGFGFRAGKGSTECELVIWDASDGRELLSLHGHSDSINSVTFAPSGKRFASGSSDTTVKIWDATKGSALLSLDEHKLPVRDVKYSPDGTKIVSAARSRFGERPSSSELKVWDSTSGEKLLDIWGHEGAIHCVAFTPDGQRIASGSQDGTVRVWDASTGQPMLVFGGFAEAVECLAFSPSGAQLVAGSARTSGLDQRPVTVTVTADDTDHGRTEVMGREWRDRGEIRMLDGKAGLRSRAIQLSNSQVRSLAFSSNGQSVVTGGSDNVVKVWNAQLGNELSSFEGPEGIRNVTFASDGTRIAMLRYLKRAFASEVFIWDAQTGRELKRLPLQGVGPGGRIASVGSRLIAGGGEEIVVFEAATGEEIQRMSSTYQGCFAASPDGSLIVSGSLDYENDEGLTVWDAESGRVIRTLKSKNGFEITPPQNDSQSQGRKLLQTYIAERVQGLVQCIAFSPDGKTVAAIFQYGRYSALRSWDTTTWDELYSVQVINSRFNSNAVMTYSPDGKRIVCGTDDGFIDFYAASRGHKVFSLAGHDSCVTCLEFSPDGNRLVSCSEDDVKVWEATRHQVKNHKTTVSEIERRLKMNAEELAGNN